MRASWLGRLLGPSERRLFWALVALDVAVAFVLPVLPGHDMPQHLAYVRLLTGWSDPSLHLAETYLEPDVSDPYSTTYRLLAAVARHSSVDLAARIAFGLYALGLSLAIAGLVRAVQRCSSRDRCPTAWLGPVLVWNPVVSMGFLPFYLALPSLVGAVAAALAYADGARTVSRRRRCVQIAALVALAYVTASLHALAAAAMLLALGLLLVVRRERAMVLPFLTSTTAVLAVALRATAAAGVAANTHLGTQLIDNVRVYGAVSGTLGTFRISFTHPAEKLDMAIANVLGAFPRSLQLAIGSGLVVVVLLAAWRRVRRRARTGATSRGVAVAFSLFAVCAALAPNAIQLPDDMCLIDFRLLTIATFFGVALVPADVFEGRLSRPVLAAFATAMVLLGARQFAGVSGETMQVVRLVDRLRAEDRVLALSFRDASDFLDGRNLVLHYAPVHHTVRNAGTTSLFWGKFTPRLPVGYRPGAEPPHPADWSPWELTDDQLDAWTHVIVSTSSDDESDERVRILAARVAHMEASSKLARVACDGRWCLFRVRETAPDTPKKCRDEAEGLGSATARCSSRHRRREERRM